MSTTFGYDIPVQGTDTRYTGLAEQVIAATSKLFQSGGTLINVFPLLRFIPPWIPGASTQRFAANAKKAWIAYQNEAFEDIKSNFVIEMLCFISFRQLRLFIARRNFQGLLIDKVAKQSFEG